MSHCIRILAIAALCLLVGIGCSRSRDAELQKALAEKEAANAEIARLKAANSEASASRQRRAADWALQNGATLTLAGDVKVENATSLPAGSLEIVEIRFPNKTKAVDDQGLASLAGLTSLKRLFIRGSSVTDAGLQHLKGLNLEALNLHATGVSNAGLAHISGMHDLTHLDVGYNRKISDVGASHLRGLTKLQFLNIYATDIGDEGLKSLEAMTGLQDLQLHGTRITSAGLERLKKLASLKRLVLPKGLNPEAVDSLRAALPNCKITIG